jgi:hypothetical protein
MGVWSVGRSARRLFLPLYSLHHVDIPPPLELNRSQWSRHLNATMS